MSTFFFNNLVVNGIDPETYMERFIVSVPHDQEFAFPSSLGNFSSTGNTTHDQFTSILDGDPVVLTYNNFTINAGHTVTTTNRCKGLYLNILGDLTVNGTLSMTARGAKSAGKYIIIDKDNKRVYYNSSLDPSFDYSPYEIIGAIGGLAHTARNLNGNPGVNGACGGGGCGHVGSASNCGFGGNGTSFSGGAGGGGKPSQSASLSGNGGANGGAGGAAATHGSYKVGGGAGNPGGSKTNGGTNGQDGTGGLMILFVKGNITIGTNGSIQSNGSRGGNGYAAGGGSGAGAIHIFHRGSINDSSKITVTGGAGGLRQPTNGYPGTDGQVGGVGSLNIIKL